MTVRELVTTLGFKVDDKGLNQYNNALDNVKTKVGSMSSAFMNVGKIIASAVATAGITALGKSILDTTSQVEQYRVSLGAMIGDQEKANRIIHDLDYSPVSDFYGTANAIGGLQGMVTFGMQAEEASETLTRLGDIAQGNSEAFKSLSLNMGQVFAKGKADGMDLKQFVQQGFDVVGETAKITGKSREEIEKAGISYEMCAKALESVTSAGGKYYQMLQKQSQTLPGLIKQFQSLTSAIKESIGNNVINSVKEIISYFIKLGKNFQENIVNIGTRAFDSLIKAMVAVIGTMEVIAMRTNGFKGLRILISSVVSVVNLLWTSLLKIFIKIGPYIDNIASVAGRVISMIVSDVVNLISTLNIVFNTVSKVVDAFFNLNPVGNIIRNIFSAIKPFIFDLETLTTVGEGLIGIVFALIGAWKVYNVVASISKTVTAILNAILLANPIMLIITGVIVGIGLLITAIVLVVKKWDKIKEAFIKFGSWAKSFFTSLINAIKNIWNRLVSFFTSLINAIKDIFTSIWTRIVDFMSSVIDVIQNIWNTIVNFFAELWENVKNTFNVFAEWAKEIFFSVVEAIKSLWNTIVNFFAELWENVKSLFIGFIDWVKVLFTDPIEAIKSLWNSLIDSFTLIMNTIQNTVFNAFENMKNKVFGFWDSVKDIIGKIGKFFGFDSDVNITETTSSATSTGVMSSKAGVTSEYITSDMSNTTSVTNNNRIEIKVPEGTTVEQARVIESMVEKAITENWENVVNSTRAMIPTPEARSY